MRLPITEIGRLIDTALRRHAGKSPMDHGAAAVQAKLASLAYLPLPVYTDATRPAATSVPAGSVIYNSTDSGLNVSNGADWMSPTWLVT
jgi:hypothetical protein